MKKFLLVILVSLFVSCVAFFKWNITLADSNDKPSSRNYNRPITIVDSVKWNANKSISDQVQKTDLDTVTSKFWCEASVNPKFTLTKTLCHLKELSKDYMQYVMYFGLVIATILLIRNWFKIVTATDREAQMKTFTKNMLYIVIWVVLLIWFYYIIDIFVSVVNLVTD